MENLANIKTVRDILSRHGFTFSKSLGQNFIVNPSVCPKMAQLCGAKNGVGVIEVGPGIGVLTNELAKTAEKVVAVELDSRLPDVLEETLADCKNVKIVSGDIMKIDIKELIETEFSGMEVVVCANLPYYITTPVIMRFLEERIPVKSITVMVQKEAADRICSPMGTRNAGAVTAAVNYYSSVQKLFTVSAGSFVPPPKVDSAVIRMDIPPVPRVRVQSEKTFFDVIKAAFAQRRKSLSNTLSAGLLPDKHTAARLLSQCGISPSARAEQLSLEQFAQLSDAVYGRLYGKA